MLHWIVKLFKCELCRRITKSAYIVSLQLGCFSFFNVVYCTVYSLTNVDQTLKLLQRLSTHLRWQLHQQETHVHSHRLQTCLQLVLSKRNKAGESQSTSWHSRQRFRHKLQFPHNFQLHWCLERDGSLQPVRPFRLSLSLLFSPILTHQQALHHIHRVKTHFYEVLCKVINGWMNEMFMLKATSSSEATLHCILFCAHNLWHDDHCRCSFIVLDYCTSMPAGRQVAECRYWQ